MRAHAACSSLKQKYECNTMFTLNIDNIDWYLFILNYETLIKIVKLKLKSIVCKILIIFTIFHKF